MAWFRREPAPLTRRLSESRVPEGMWVKCGSCKEILYRKDVIRNVSVCPKCAFHFRISARERLDSLFDVAWEEFDRGLVSSDPLSLRDSKPYSERLRGGKAKTDSFDALVSAAGSMGGYRTVVGAMEYGFIGGSMGVVVGEKVTRSVERALAEKLPLLATERGTETMIIADLEQIQGRTYPARRRTQNIVGGMSPIQATNFSMGYVTLEPERGQVPWHNQEQEEIYFIVDGLAEMCLGEEPRTLTSGQAVYIPPGVFHQITNVSERPCRMMYIYGPAGDVAHWRQELDGTLPRAGIEAPPLPEGARPQWTGRTGG